MKIVTLITFVLLLLITALFAQDIQKTEIINSGRYYFGSGISDNSREAKEKALKELSEQIVVRVSTEFVMKTYESEEKIGSDVESIIRTYSTATLKDVQMLNRIIDNEHIEVFCFLLKTEVEKNFDKRKNFAYDLFRKAVEYREDANFSHALKYYYYSLLLLNSLPDENIKLNGRELTQAIPNAINDILLHTEFDIVDDRRISEIEREIVIDVNTFGRPAGLMDFTFWDGAKQISVQARNGRASLLLLGSGVDLNELKLNIKYAYYNSRDELKIIDDLWPLVIHPTFNAAQTLDAGAPGEESRGRFKNRDDISLDMGDYSAVPNSDFVLKQAAEFIKLFSTNNPGLIAQAFAGDLFFQNKLLDYFKLNSPTLIDGAIDGLLNNTAAGSEFRKIPVTHSYPGLNMFSTEFVVLDFDSAGQLNNLNLSLTDQMYEQIGEQSKYGKDWDKRQAIIKFIERYRTAYLTRDMSTVDLMYAEDALIIVGRKVEPKKMSDGKFTYMKFGNQPEYEYIKLDKRRYLKRLNSLFDAQIEILLDFSSLKIIRKTNADKVYGVEIRQNYYSTNYSDEGFLFLLIDFSEEDPLIYVRAWQPNEWAEKSLIRTANFKIHQ